MDIAANARETADLPCTTDKTDVKFRGVLEE
jgi:hypothetical protein